MKLRIKGNSLRLRIARSEVTRLLVGDCLEETIHFAPEESAKLTYAIQQDASVSIPTVQYTENKVEILIPANQANVWGVTDQVGIAEDIGLGDLGSLALLIEKTSPAGMEATKIIAIPSRTQTPVQHVSQVGSTGYSPLTSTIRIDARLRFALRVALVDRRLCRPFDGGPSLLQLRSQG